MRTIIGVDEENIEKVWDRMVTLLQIINKAPTHEAKEEARDILAPMLWTMSAILDREDIDVIEEVNARLAVRNV